jgi:hypothetical protein
MQSPPIFQLHLTLQLGHCSEQDKIALCAYDGAAYEARRFQTASSCPGASRPLSISLGVIREDALISDS